MRENISYSIHLFFWSGVFLVAQTNINEDFLGQGILSHLGALLVLLSVCMSIYEARKGKRKDE